MSRNASAVTLMVLACLLACAGCNLFVDADARVARANRRIASGDYEGAAIELKNVVQKQPDHIQARLLLAEVSLRQGDVADADKELRRALESGAEPAETAELAAKISLGMGRAKELLIQIDSGEVPLAEPQRSIYRGYALLGQGQPDLAVDAFAAALRTDPGSSLARTALAEALATKGQTQEALSELNKVLAGEPRNAEALLMQGRVLARRGQFVEAQESLVAAQQSMAALTVAQQVALLSTLTEARLAKGDIAGGRASHGQLAAVASGALVTRMLAARISMATQDYAAASAELQRVVTARPDMTMARFLLGAASLAQGNLNQAEFQLARVVQEAPENVEARKLLAQVRLRLEQPDAAMEVLIPAQQVEDTDPQVNALLGLAHLQLGDEAGALVFLERSAASKPDDRQTQLDLAATYIGTGEHQKAATLLRSIPHLDDDSRRESLLVAAVDAGSGVKAARQQVEALLDSYAGNTTILNLAGAFFARHGEFERARAALADALAKKPRDVPTLLNSARVEAAAGDLATASARLDSALAIDPDNNTARLALAELAVRKGDITTATRWLEDARKRNPKAFEPRLRLARVYLQAKRTREADELLREIGASATGRHDVLNAIGLLYLDAGRYDEAISRFRAAAELDSRNAAYWLNLARAQLAIDRSAPARESLEKARAARPDSLGALGALVMLDIKDGKPDAAAARVAQLRKDRPNDASVLLLEGDFYMAQKQFAKADASYDKAAALRLDAMTALKSYRARSLSKLGNAAVPLETWLSRHPEDFATQAVLAEEYQRSGQRQRAIEKYELILRNKPSSAVALNNLAWLYQQTGDSRAEMTALRAYQIAPAVAVIADTYGWILVENGKLAEGIEILKRAADAAAGAPDIAFHYAAALARSGDKQTARQRLTSLLDAYKVFETQPEASRLLQELSQ